MVNLKMTGKMKKILTLIAAMAAFVACSKVDVTAPDADETQNREIKFNINVGGFGGPETKAVKTDWASGDKINIWFNCNYSQVPDLVMTYDGSAWSYGDLDDTVAPEDGQKFVAVYEGFNDLSQYDYVDYYFRSPSYYGGYNFPMVVCSKGTYEYSDDTITADLSAGWAFGTRLQVYVDGLSQEKPYGLSCSSLRPLTLFGPTEAGVFAFSKESGAGSVAQGVPFGEGVAFYFYDNYTGNGNSADYYFELIEYSAFGLPVSNRRYAVLGKTVTIDSKKCQGISIAASKFTGLLNNHSATLIVGENVTLGITEGYPTDGLTWGSSNYDVATVDQTGKVTAVSEGTAIITVNNADGTMSDICEVTVNASHVTSISLNTTSISCLTVGGSSQLTATVLPESAFDKSVTWTSSNTLVATVDDTGEVRGISEGSATITATTADGGLTATCSVTVVRLLKNHSATLIVGENITLGITEGCPTDGLTWSSSNNDVATVDQTGKVTAVSEGTTVITVNNADGTMSDICEVTVNAIHVTSISLNATSISGLTVGSSSQLTATILPEYASNKSVTWTSSNTLVATVDNTGKVTALSEGSATITATTVDGGLSATCSVTVVPDIALKGVFSVSTTRKVRFSPGNLQATYNGTDYTFGFAEHQYDFIGNAAGNTTIDSQTSGSVVDLFGWSTAATKYGISTATSNSNYSGDFVDWGSAIGPWRTLSSDEWTYLLNTRAVNGGKKEGYSYQRATINYDGTGVYGLIIYPDGYTDQLATDICSCSKWNDMEEAGCVFLPAAGRRFGSNVSGVGDNGYYWSSTASGSYDAYRVSFSSGSVSPGDVGSRNSGYSVRLITDVEE